MKTEERSVEIRAGIAPANSGFADRRVSYFTTGSISHFSIKCGIFALMTLGKIFGLILIFLGLGSLAAALVTYLLTSSKPKAGLRIETNPPAMVFIDDVQEGQTPFEKNFTAKEVLVKLVPNSTSSAISSYQTRIRLTDGLTSIIRRNFSYPESASFGENISFQSDPNGQSPISVITSEPESATVFIDGRSQGLSPIIISDSLAGEHQLALTSTGYAPKTITLKNPAGFRTQVSAKLSLLAITPTPTPSTTSATLVKSVKIKDTPTGFLRVRNAPNSNGAEVGQVKPNQTYPLLSQLTGWYQIKVDFEATTSGWISSQYSTLSN